MDVLPNYWKDSTLYFEKSDIEGLGGETVAYSMT
jgi:hypothetical protein